MARQKGFEPLTHGLEGRCSFHLSYWRESGRADLNGRPPAPKAGALPGCATPRAISNNTRPWRPQPHIRHGDVATRSRDDSAPVDHGVRDRKSRSQRASFAICSGTRRCGVKSKIETADAMRSKLRRTRVRVRTRSRGANFRRSKLRHLLSDQGIMSCDSVKGSSSGARERAAAGGTARAASHLRRVLRITTEISRLESIFGGFRSYRRNSRRESG